MNHNWAECFQYYDNLLTEKGWKEYFGYYYLSASNFFDPKYDDVQYDHENHTILVKYADQDYDEDELGRYFSLDLYVKQATAQAESTTLKKIDLELSLLLEDEFKFQVPLLIGYVLHILELTKKSTYSYRESLTESLNQIVLHLRQSYRKAFTEGHQLTPGMGQFLGSVA